LLGSGKEETRFDRRAGQWTSKLPGNVSLDQSFIRFILVSTCGVNIRELLEDLLASTRIC
jgi:hypothetical protein